MEARNELINICYTFIFFFLASFGLVGLAVVAIGYMLRLPNWIRLGKLFLLRPAGGVFAIGVVLAVLNAVSAKNSGSPPLDPEQLLLPEFNPVMAEFLSWFKWIALACIVALGFVGIAFVAVGRATGNLDWSEYGQKGLLLGGVLSVLLGTSFGLLDGLFNVF